MSQRHAKWKSTTFLIVLFFMQHGTCEAVPPMGSILFEDHGFAKKCFVQNDIALLSTRLKFQDLLLNESEFKMLSDDDVDATIRYFYGVNEIIEKLNEDDVRQLVQKSFYDMLGSYLKHQLLPIAKFSFYSGNVTFTVVQNVFNLYERCKELLDTNGNGWSEPITDFSSFAIKIDPLDIKKQTTDDEPMKACVNLALNQNDDDNEEDMLVPLPKIETEDNEELSTIWLPLKRKHIFNINSKTSAFILFRYFVMVTQCYNYQGTNQSIFNRKLKLWIVENVLPYLDDENWYPAFGAVLRILETVKEPNESVYQGTKGKPSRRHRLLGSQSLKFMDEEGGNFFNFYTDDDDFQWWFYIGSIIAAAFIVLILIVCLLTRITRNRKKCEEKFDPSRKKGCWQRLKAIFIKSTHHPENDDFYEYKKVPSDTRTVVFENEKRSKKSTGMFRKANSKKPIKEKFNLPLLATDSEDDVVLHEKISNKKTSSGSSIHNPFKIKKKNTSDTTFKISESSDDGGKAKKSIVKSPIVSQQSSVQTGFLNKFRPRSPQQESRVDRTDQSRRQSHEKVVGPER